MNLNISLGDVLDFILANRGDKVFIGLSPEQIGGILRKGAKDGTMLVAANNEGKITGMIYAEILPGNDKVLWVTYNLAMNLENLRTFAKIAKERMPDYKLQWRKHGVEKRHNTEHIYAKLLPA